MRNKKTYFIIIILVILISGILYVGKNIGKEQNRIIQNIKYLIPTKLKNFIKENIFVHQYKNKLKNQILYKNKKIGELYDEIDKVFEYSYAYNFSKTLTEEIKIEKKIITLKKFTLSPLKYQGPRSYIQYYEDKLFLINGSGALMYTNKKNILEEKLIFNKIDTDLVNILKKKNQKLIQIKDFLIDDNKIYISFLNKKKDSCFINTIFEGNLELDKIELKEFFSTNECRKESTPSVGGNLSKFKNNKILITIGDYYCYENDDSDFCEKNLPQSMNSFMGKIISLEKKSGKHKFVSLGHRNSQGLFYDETSNIILSTDHGPEGGDEININFLSNEKIKNYGWPIASYGEHYESSNLKDKYEIAPLKKSHKKYGFNEPLKYFTPAIGISQIIRTNNFIEKNNYEILVASLGFDLDEGDLSLHQIVLNNKYKIIKYNKIPIKERIRDITYMKDLNKIFLFLETSGSIATLDIN